MDKKSLARVIVLIITLINLFLDKASLPHIPEVFGDYTAEMIVFVMSLWAAHKNNYIFKKGQAQKELLEKHNLK